MPIYSVPFRWDYKPPFGSTIDFNNPITKDLYGVWLFNEGGGSNYFDLSPFNHPSGTFSIARPNWVITNYGYGLDFSSIGGREVRIQPKTNNTYFTAENNIFSVFAVVAPSSFPGAVFSVGESSDSNSSLTFGIYSTSGSVAVGTNGLGTAGGGAFAMVPGTGIPRNGTYSRIGISQKSATARDFLFDGRIFPNTTTLTTNAIGVGQAITIGTDYINSVRTAGDDWKGKIDCVYVWKRAIDPGELLALNNDPFLFFNPPTDRQYTYISPTVLQAAEPSGPTNFTIYPSGWLEESFGTATITRGDWTVYPSGFTTENFGVCRFIAGQVFIRPSGFAGGSFGVDSFNPGGFSCRASGWSGTAFGIDTFLPGIVYIRPSGFFAGSMGTPNCTYFINGGGFGHEIFGTASFSPGPVQIRPIGFAEAFFGIDRFTTGAFSVRPSGFGTEVFGVDYINPGAWSVRESGFFGGSFGIDQFNPGGFSVRESGFTGTLFGTDYINPGPIGIRPSGFGGTTFGTDYFTLTIPGIIIPIGFVGTAFGVDTITSGPIQIKPSGFITATFGSDQINPGQVVCRPSGFAFEAFGVDTITRGSTYFIPSGITPGNFGTDQFTTGGVTVRGSGYTTELFGIDTFLPGVRTFYPSGTPTSLSFGLHSFVAFPPQIYPGGFVGFRDGIATIQSGPVSISTVGSLLETFGSHLVFNVFTGNLHIFHEVKYISRSYVADAVVDLDHT